MLPRHAVEEERVAMADVALKVIYSPSPRAGVRVVPADRVPLSTEEADGVIAVGVLRSGPRAGEGQIEAFERRRWECCRDRDGDRHAGWMPGRRRDLQIFHDDVLLRALPGEAGANPGHTELGDDGLELSVRHRRP